MGLSVTAAWMKEERSRSATAELGNVSSLGRPPLRYEHLLIRWSSVTRFRATWGKFYRGGFPALLRPSEVGSRAPGFQAAFYWTDDIFVAPTPGP